MVNETGAVRVTGRWRKVVVCVVVLLVLAELLTRLIASHLQAPLQWDTYETQRKVQQIDALSKHGGARIVYVGSSIVDDGIEPSVIDQQLGLSGGVVSYNAGLTASIPRMTRSWLRYVVIPKLHPKVIVLGLNPFDLDAGDFNRNSVYDLYVGSSGARQIMHTDDPIQAADRWLGQVSSLWLHKYQLRDPAALLHAVEGKPAPVDIGAADVDPLGRQTEDQNVHYVNAATITVNGWSLDAQGVDDVKGLISLAHAHHIQVVLVNMPVTKEFVAEMPHGQTTYDIFNKEVAALGRQSGSAVLNYQKVSNHAFFKDNIHLNYVGTELFSTRLGQALRAMVG
jgi:hypothetical protein